MDSRDTARYRGVAAAHSSWGAARAVGSLRDRRMASGDSDAIDPMETTGFMGGKLAASVLLIRDGAAGLEVWVQERVATMAHYPRHAVFPGGGVDRRDFPPRTWDSGDLWHGASVISKARLMGVNKFKAHALVFAAARELFEEAGTLLASGADDAPVSDASCYHGSRNQLETHQLSFTEFLRAHHLRVDADRLHPFARWVGSSGASQLFDTFFFVAEIPQGQEPDGLTGEADDAGWFPPQLILDGWRAGLVRLVLPTWSNLSRLAAYDSVAEAMADVSFSDLRPIVGDPHDDPRFYDFFSTDRVDRL